MLYLNGKEVLKYRNPLRCNDITTMGFNVKFYGGVEC